MVNASSPAALAMPSRIDYKYKRVTAPFPPHTFTQHDTPSSNDQSLGTSPSHHKQSSLSIQQPILPQPGSFVSVPLVHADVSSTSSAPPTTTHTHSRFPAVGPPRPFSSAQSVRPRIVRTEDDDDDRDNGDECDDEAGSVRDGFSDTNSAYSAFSRSREGLDKMREEREVRVREEEKRRSEERARLEKVAAVAHKATQMRLRAASAEQAKRKEEEDELRAVVAQVQAREEKQKQEERLRKIKQTEQQRREQQHAERRQGEERKEDEERQVERAKEASMRREHSNGTVQASRLRREPQVASPPPFLTTSVSQSTTTSLLPPTSAASKRSIRSDLLASSLPSNPSYYPTHIHSLLSTAFLPPLSRLFKHYHQRAPSSSASPAYVDMAGGVRASVLSSGDWLLMMSECGVSGVLLSKDGLKRVYMLSVRTERKRSDVEAKEEVSDERKNGLGLGRFLKSLWCVARSVGGNDRAEDAESGRQEADMRVMLALLEFIGHHATPQRLGAQLKLQWPDLTLKEAVEVHCRLTPPAAYQSRPARRREEQKAANVDTQDRSTDNASPATTTIIVRPPHTQPTTSRSPAAPAAADTAADDAGERERKERKRLRLKMRVERYRREQEEKEKTKAEEERRKKVEEEDREAERRRKEERLREDEKRKIAEFRARRKEEVEEMARTEAEKAEREERDRKRALELYVRQKAERKRREEAEQRQRLMHFHQQLYAQEAAEAASDNSDHRQRQQPLVLKEETKRRQWDKRPLQYLDAPSLVSAHSPASSPSSETRTPALPMSAYASPPVSSVMAPVQSGASGLSEDELLSVGGESSSTLDGVDADEEMF